MATPTDKKSIDMMAKIFSESLKPIWPNLTRKQCELDFSYYRNQQRRSLYAHTNRPTRALKGQSINYLEPWRDNFR